MYSISVVRGHVNEIERRMERLNNELTELNQCLDGLLRCCREGEIEFSLNAELKDTGKSYIEPVRCAQISMP